MKLSEGTEFRIDIKTVISIIVTTSMFVGMYYTLQSDIEEAKELPKATIDRIEYDLKREWLEKHIMRSEEDIDALERKVEQLDKELHLYISKTRKK